MKILGLCCGRKMGNSEILVKEALMGAEEVGADVELVRLMDLDLKPCTGCSACVNDVFEKGGSGECTIKDDLKFIEKKIMECDGLIVGSPIYEKSPTGYLKILSDRMSTSFDMSFKMKAKKIREEKGITGGIDSKEVESKPRVASLFAVGGKNLSELALPMMQLFVMPMQMTVVDQYLFNLNSLPSGAVTLIKEPLERARMSGKHVAETLMKPIEEASYMGEVGICPICHAKLLEMTNSLSTAKCAVCGVNGHLKVDGDQVIFEVNEEFIEDLINNSTMQLNMSEIPANLEKYKSYLKYSKPIPNNIVHMNGYSF